MSDINEVRERLERAIETRRGSGAASDVEALLADHARLQAAHADALKAMRKAVIALAHAQESDPVYQSAYGVLGAAIDAAKAVQS